MTHNEKRPEARGRQQGEACNVYKLGGFLTKTIIETIKGTKNKLS